MMNLRYLTRGGLGLTLGFGLLSCQQEEMRTLGEGHLSLEVKLNTEVQTKSTSTAKLDQTATIRIYNEQGLVRRYQGLDQVPTRVALMSDQYELKAEAGLRVPATFEMPFYEGEKHFEITPAEVTQVQVPLKIANSVVTIQSHNLEAIFTDFDVKVALLEDTLHYQGAYLNHKGYFLPQHESTTLTWEFSARGINGKDYNQKGLIAHPKPAHLYELTFLSDTTQTGGTFFEVVVNEQEIVQKDTVGIALRPQWQGIDFDLNQMYNLETNYSTTLAVALKAFAPLREVQLHSSSFPTLGFASDTLVLVPCSQEQKTHYESLGVYVEQEGNNAIIHFKEEFMLALTAQEGIHEVAYVAMDELGKVRKQVLNLTVTDASFTTLPVDGVTVWANRAVLKGEVLQEIDGARYAFRYRPVGTDAWLTQEATLTGAYFTASLASLIPDTDYEYQAVSGEEVAMVVEYFTTEAAKQLPNQSFEFWHTLGKVDLIFGVDQQMFWDSGNHGSSTMSVNVTQYDENLFHSGSRSIVLRSQFVGVSVFGKFAAGNLFAGKYLKTDGTSGVISFGRPFESRPTKVRAYYRYQTGEVNYTDDASKIAKGVPDTMAFYVALGDWEPTEFEGYEAPVLIKNNPKDLSLFDPKGEHVIAYGEHEQGASTEGEGLHLIEFALDYTTLTRKPTHIVVVASASKYGDYYAGSTASVLWLDDVELIYE